MEKAKRVFAFLGLVWVIDILFSLIFHGTWLNWYTIGVNLFIKLSGASVESAHVSWESRVFLVAFTAVPACLIILAVRSVLARVAKKAQANV